MIVYLNNGAVLGWAEFIWTNRLWNREESELSLNQLFYFLPQSLSAAQRSPMNRRRVEGWGTWWLWLEVIYDHKLHFYRVMCSSFTTCGERCCMTGLITLFAGNVNLWEAVALCCLQDEGELLYTSVRARTRCVTALVFKPAAVFQKPLGQICLPHSAARRPPPLAAEPLCSLRTILPARSPRLQRAPPPVWPFRTFPPLLMRIND